jgi:hypothetical protein
MGCFLRLSCVMICYMDVGKNEYQQSLEARRRRVRDLADSAENWQKEVDLIHYPSLHISKALQGIPEGKERDRLFGEVRKELKRRKDKRRQEEEYLAETRKAELMRGAYAHAKRNLVEEDTWYDPTMSDEDNNESS